MKYKCLLSLSIVFLCGFNKGYSQDNLEKVQLFNEGTLYLLPNTMLTVKYDFINENNGVVLSDGLVYYYEDFINNGQYDVATGLKKSSTYFIIKPDKKEKKISGDGYASFYDVAFDSGVESNPFNLLTNIDIYGKANFIDGIIKVDSTKNEKTKISNGMITFMPGASYLNAHDYGHVEGVVEKIGNESFVFPIGDQQRYRPGRISAPSNIKNAITARYVSSDSLFFEKNSTISGIINELDRSEYWELRTGLDQESEIILTLSWDDRTTPNQLLINPEKDLRIVRWDSKQQLWIDEGGVVNVEKKEISTPTTINKLGFFTLATAKTHLLLDGDVVIYNMVSTMEDGKNDYFLIDNIRNFPNNTVQIYNRWGVKVYETSNYDSNGNVFKGYSEGRVTLNKNKKLPTGTYYYIINYEYRDISGSRMIKKTGYLHLEND